MSQSGDDDDDVTPPRREPSQRQYRAGSQWGDDRRATVGALRRRTPPPIAIDRELGAVVAHEMSLDDVTSPIELLERPTDDRAAEVKRRLLRETPDPLQAIADYLAKLAISVEAKHKEHRSGHRENADRLLAILDRVPGEAAAELRAQLEALEARFEAHMATIGSPAEPNGTLVVWHAIDRLTRANNVAKWLLRAVATSAITAVLFVGGVIWNRATQQERSDVVIQYLQQRISRLEALSDERSHTSTP